MNNYGAVLSVADDILTLPAEVEALPLCSSAFCGAACSCAPPVGRGHSPLTLVESRHERGRLSRPTPHHTHHRHIHPSVQFFEELCPRIPTPGFGILGQPLAENKVERAGGGLWWWWWW